MADVSLINRHGTQRDVFTDIDIVEIDNADCSGVERFLLQGSEKPNTVWWTVDASQNAWEAAYFNKSIDWEKIFVGIDYFNSKVEIGSAQTDSQTRLNFFCFNYTHILDGLYLLVCYNSVVGITADNFKIIYSTKAFTNIPFGSITVSATVGWNNSIIPFSYPCSVTFYDDILFTYNNLPTDTPYEADKYYEKVENNYVLLDTAEPPEGWTEDCTVYYEKVAVDTTVLAAGTPVAFGTQVKAVSPSASEQTVTADSEYSSLYKVIVYGAPLQDKTGITPTTSSQTIEADYGYYGLSSVQIDGMLLEEKTVDLSFPNEAPTQEVNPTDGYNMSKVTINRPNNLTHEHIESGVTIAGITGTFEGGKPEETQTVTLDFSNGLQTQSVYPTTADYVMTRVDITRPSNLSASNIKNNVSIAGVTGNVVQGLSDYMWQVGANVYALYFNPQIPNDVLTFLLTFGTSFETSVTIDGQTIPAHYVGFTYLYLLDLRSIVSGLEVLAWCYPSNPILIWTPAAFEAGGFKAFSVGLQRLYIDVSSLNITIDSATAAAPNYIINFFIGIGTDYSHQILSPVTSFSKYYRPSYLLNQGDTPAALYFNIQYNPISLFSKLIYDQTATISIGGQSVTFDYALLGLSYLIAIDLSSIDQSYTGGYTIAWNQNNSLTVVYSTISVEELMISRAGWQISDISTDDITVDYQTCNPEFLKIIDEFVCKTKTLFGGKIEAGNITITGNVLKFYDDSYVTDNVLHLVSDESVVGNILKINASNMVNEEELFEELNNELWGLDI